MIPHCYYVTASVYMDLNAYQAARRNKRNFRILSDKKGVELADEIEAIIRREYDKYRTAGFELFNLAIENIFDCGEVNPEVLEPTDGLQPLQPET